MYSWNEILHVSDIFSVHYQELFTVNTAMIYVTQVMLTACEQDQDGTGQFHPDPARKLSVKLYDIYDCCVYSEKLLIMDRENVRNM
jgi:hypothetical protein